MDLEIIIIGNLPDKFIKKSFFYKITKNKVFYLIIMNTLLKNWPN